MTTKKELRLKVTAEVELVYPVEILEDEGYSTSGEGLTELKKLVESRLDELLRERVYNDESNVEAQGYYSTAHKLDVELVEEAEVSEQ